MKQTAIKLIRIIIFLALLASFVPMRDVNAAGLCYVNSNAVSGTNNGTSWSNAYLSLQSALADNCTEIWVATGIYRPHNSDPEISFNLESGVAIYGGFNGTETLLSERDYLANVTILSGDLNFDDVGFTNNGENSCIVVTGGNTNNTAVLDGFTITGGNAYDVYRCSNRGNYGGGILNYQSSPTLANLIITTNMARRGGGIYNNVLSSPTLTNISIKNNRADYGTGGGMFNENGSSPLLTNVSFIGNTAIYGWGGGMALDNQSNPVLINVTFSDNSAQNGGGMYSGLITYPVLTNVTFSDNAAGSGGGMYNSPYSNPTLTNITFSGNSASPGNGAGVQNNHDTNLTLINVIIANSTSGGDCVNDGGTINTSSANNLIEDTSNACGLINGSNGNILGLDPKLGSLTDNGGFTQTMALLNGSPAINAGTNTGCPATDQREVARPQGAACDIGAYEYVVDNTAPVITSITRTTISPTSTASVDFTVTFSESVTDVNANGSDFELFTTGVTGASITSVTPVSASVYTVSVNTGTGNGSIRLDVHDAATIKDISNNDLSGLPFTTGETYIITKVDIAVTIGGVNRGTYGLAPGSSQRVNYAGLDAGPVVVNATNDVPIIAALRDAYFVNGQVESFVQLMGLPEAQLSTKYYFPAYNNVTLDGQLRFGNVGNSNTTVTVTIAGVVRGTYDLTPGQAKRVNYTGLDAGPVIVESSGGVPIIAALRDAYFVNGQIESFAQLMGLPASQLSDTYYFPAYNNVSLNGQLRVGNVDSVSTTVTVTIAGVVRGTYPLAPNEAVRINYAGLDAGPVVVQSSGGVKIIAALRDAYFVNGQVTSFVQLMGLPASQLSTKYYFPAYNNVSLDGQLRFGNVGNSNTTVTVTIGGVVRGTYNLAPGQAQRVNYAGLDAGPVVVESSGGVPIIAALRDAYFVNGVLESFAQLMGLPDAALSPTYYFPAYNNVSLNGQLRFGVP